MKSKLKEMIREELQNLNELDFSFNSIPPTKISITDGGKLLIQQASRMIFFSADELKKLMMWLNKNKSKVFKEMTSRGGS